MLWHNYVQINNDECQVFKSLYIIKAECSLKSCLVKVMNILIQYLVIIPTNQELQWLSVFTY